jgi:distribution and morphology protein 34
MSFSFQWPRFSDQFHADAIEMLNAALNKGPKPPVIADKIEVVELEMGTQVRLFPSSHRYFLPAHSSTSPSRVACQPPELEIRDIGDLTMEQFRGIFRLTYNGDAHLVLRTKVQVCDDPCPRSLFFSHPIARALVAHPVFCRGKAHVFSTFL